MIFQKFLKGITGLTRADAQNIFAGGGITCNWWRNNNPLPENEIPDRLTEQNIFRHLNDYPNFGHETPFISATAGGVERDNTHQINLRFSAFLTSLAFATQNYTASGAIFYGYVNVLGRKSIRLREFAEETRELNIWTDFQPYHREGEIMAKISISSPHIEKAVGYDGPSVLRELNALGTPTPSWEEQNTTRYIPPEDVCNIREVVL